MRIDHFLEKSDIPKPLRKYLDHQWTSGGVAGPDYRAFQASYGRWLKKLLKGYKVEIHPNHYEFSAVVTRKGEDGAPDRYVYLSISDVRFWHNGWVYDILVRQMQHPRDWCGCRNHTAQIDTIKEWVDSLMDKPLEARL